MSVSKEDIDTILAESSEYGFKATGTATWLTYFLSALVTCTLTVYLYLTPMFELTLQDHGTHLAAGTAISTILLASTYDKSAKSKIIQLQRLREDATIAGKKNTQKQDTVFCLNQSTCTEAVT